MCTPVVKIMYYMYRLSKGKDYTSISLCSLSRFIILTQFWYDVTCFAKTQHNTYEKDYLDYTK